MRQLGALRRPGRARRVEDHRGVVVVALGDALSARRGRAPARTHRARRAMHSAPASSAPASRRLGEVVPGEQQLRARSRRGRTPTSRSLSSTFIGTTTRAGAQDAVVDDGEVRDVGQHDPDAVAGLDAVARSSPATRALPASSARRSARLVEFQPDCVPDRLGTVRRSMQGSAHGGGYPALYG